MEMTNDKAKILKATFLIMAVAMIISFCVKPVVQAQVGGESANASVYSSGSGMNRVIKNSENIPEISVEKFLKNIWRNTGIYKFIHTESAEDLAAEKAEKAAEEAAMEKDPFVDTVVPGWQKLLMIAIGFLIVYLGAGRGFEPLLLIPIGFGTILVNIPGAGMGDAPHGMLHIIYSAGVGNEFFPMLIFMGIGAMTDFGPLIANPKMALLGGAAQFGVFFTLFGVALMNLIPGINVDYNMMEASAIAIIGGALRT